MARTAAAPTTRKRSSARRAHEVAGTAKPIIVSRRSASGNAKRAKRRYAAHTLTASWEDRMWREQQQRERADRRAEQGPRHWYGAWTPYGVSAWAGGHPGRALRRAHRKVRRKVRRIIRGR